MSLSDLVAVAEVARPSVGIVAACQALSLPRATFYRRNGSPRARSAVALTSCRVPGRGLSPQEEEQVLAELHSDRFVDLAPPQVYSTLLDEGKYLCSISTMYRLLRERDEVVERRRLRKHAPAQRPELLAMGPNQVWSWDITKLKGPRKWSYYYLYVIIDVFSRYVVGWCIAEKENASIAEALIQETLLREQIQPGALTIHADRGSAMTSTTVAQLLIDLGVVKSHSRPHTSNDNPYSESHFKTLKYRPQMPERFGCVEEARILFRLLISWYNHEHRHSGLGLLSPATVHAGRAAAATSARAMVLDQAYAAHPQRFVRQPPRPPLLPAAVWINRPIPPPNEPSRDASGGFVATASANN
jgi:putative transposase